MTFKLRAFGDTRPRAPGIASIALNNWNTRSWTHERESALGTPSASDRKTALAPTMAGNTRAFAAPGLDRTERGSHLDSQPACPQATVLPVRQTNALIRVAIFLSSSDRHDPVSSRPGFSIRIFDRLTCHVMRATGAKGAGSWLDRQRCYSPLWSLERASVARGPFRAVVRVSCNVTAAPPAAGEVSPRAHVENACRPRDLLVAASSAT